MISIDGLCYFWYNVVTTELRNSSDRDSHKRKKPRSVYVIHLARAYSCKGITRMTTHTNLVGTRSFILANSSDNARALFSPHINADVAPNSYSTFQIGLLAYPACPFCNGNVTHDVCSECRGSGQGYLSDLSDQELVDHYKEMVGLAEEITQPIDGESDWAYDSRCNAVGEMLATIHQNFWRPERQELWGYAAYSAPHLTLQVVSVDGQKKLMEMIDASQLSVNDGKADSRDIGRVTWDETPMMSWDGEIHYVHPSRCEAPPTYTPTCSATDCEQPQEVGDICNACFTDSQTPVTLMTSRRVGYPLQETFTDLQSARERLEELKKYNNFIEGAIQEAYPQHKQYDEMYHLTTFHNAPILGVGTDVVDYPSHLSFVPPSPPRVTLATEAATSVKQQQTEIVITAHPLTRAEKADAIIDSLVYVGGNAFTYQGSEPKPYHINVALKACSCPDHRIRKVKCKHLIAAQQHPQYLNKLEQEQQRRERENALPVQKRRRGKSIFK